MSGGDEINFECFLPISRDAAFALVVDTPARWWFSPFSSNLARPEPVSEVAIEPYAGGVCYELAPSGAHRVWGTILSIEPPLFLRLSWQVAPNCEPIADPLAASRVMIQFRSAGETGTRLEISHSEFIRHGPNGARFRDFMRSQNGWPLMLANLSHSAREAKRG